MRVLLGENSLLRSLARSVRRALRRAFATSLNLDDILHWPKVFTTDWPSWLKRLGIQRPSESTLEQQDRGFQKVIARYENTLEDRMLFPLGITMPGCQPYLGYLILQVLPQSFITLEEIMGFHASLSQAGNDAYTLALTYLNQPSWQKRFPQALFEDHSWNNLLGWVVAEYGVGRRHLNSCPRPKGMVANDQPDVQVVGHFGYPSGLEVAALTVAAGLEAVGKRVGLRQISATQVDPPRDMAMRALIQAPQTIVVMSPEPYFADWPQRAGVFLPQAHRTFAIWYWEVEEVPFSWKELAHGASEIWAPTRFIQQALMRVVDVPVEPMLPGVTLTSFTKLARSQFQIPGKGFLFLFIFDLASVMERKNPLGLIRAFKQAFPGSEEVTLVLKISRSRQYPAQMARIRAEANDPRMILLDEDMSREKVLALLDLCDAYVSLHRSEGFGLTMAEAMLLGKPVIATAYSGNMDFMDANTALMVPYKRIALKEDHPPYRQGDHWADPDEAGAATMMRSLWEHPEKAKALGEAGRLKVTELLSVESAGRRMADRLMA